ncbi:potassium channel subfamily T member 2-like [Haliotis cracherodii]|uniref:potassium channel subfamily T member 2-like n=1 Tax=Haliotis cracherodii TaxID=6455 RepID=UPI0039EABC47
MAESATTCDGVDLAWMYQETGDDEDDQDWADGSPVKYFTHELSMRGRLRRLLIKNPTTRLCSTIFDLAVKTIVCTLYVTRVCIDDLEVYACHGSACNENSTEVATADHINWYVILWVSRPLALWIVQIFLAIITLIKALLQIYVMTKGRRHENILQPGFLLELFCSVPVIATVAYPVLLKDLFLPIFLNVWLVKMALERLFNDLHLTKQRFQTISVTLSQQILLLNVTLFCLIFTTICGIQHIQRSSALVKLNMFESVYFVIVTFSTVGYGDISPDIWVGRLFMLFMICVAFAFIPRQLEEIGSTYVQRKQSGGEYGRRKAARNKHVVVCSTSLTTETVMNFLNEFYAHPKLEEHTVVLMSSDELDTSMQMILKDPKWANRVLYIRGSALKDIDLKRCRINDAEACFFLAAKNCGCRDKAEMIRFDQHTILRSWAVKDFAPKCRQYVQLFRAENKMHVKFAEHVVCEDEFKYALLANNCLYPGLSTLVTLLLHTSRGREGELATEAWQQVYGRHSGNEVYHIQLNRSAFFKQYDGKKFTEASACAHTRFGVSLVAVLDVTKSEPSLQLNPGPDYILKGSDYCFYMGVTREENSKIKSGAMENVSVSANRNKNIELISNEIQKWLQSEGEGEDVEDDESVFSTITSQLGSSISRRLMQTGESEGQGNDQNGHTQENGQSPSSTTQTGPISLPLLKITVDNIEESSEPNSPDYDCTDTLDTVNESTPSPIGKVMGLFPEAALDGYMTGSPPSTLYVGTRRTKCHLHQDPRPYCCLEWGQNCDHCQTKTAKDDHWKGQIIILAAEYASTGIYNFIVPLRTSFHSLGSLSPIVLLLEQEPDTMFLETIAAFPLVYWLQGKISSIDDLLRAGINHASHVVISNKESDIDASEETLADAETVVTVQKISRLFPNTNVITELNDASNMRFMQFQAHDVYSQEISKLEKKLKERTSSNLPHLFRLPFAAGQVFSAGMLDRLLYQTFVKGYLISFVRLLLGIDAQHNSGHLSSVRVRRATLVQFPTYGELYEGLCSTTGEIPIAIYRSEKRPTPVVSSDPDIRSMNNNISKPRQPKYKQSIASKMYFSDTDQNEARDLINSRMKSLNITDDQSPAKEQDSLLSYVIVNPSPKRKLKNGDMIYVIQPSTMMAVPSKLRSKTQRNVSAKHLNFTVNSVPTPTLTRTSQTRVSWNLSAHTENPKPNGSRPSDYRFRSKSESQVPKVE